ncbi:hypothetical protein ACVGVM_28705 (plasmid) [Pseudonocardia bannensis]|uniref:Uncharacterized protein n=1 Tax=Pseudonocardia bannensis TaxID=630973 RepID=A0A848DHN3_9PSEU|nr:hypothetical protein [Pseudonocardia bannensis]NMH92076.1 hypothetical protein [Pseudonocardia bannensis]
MSITGTVIGIPKGIRRSIAGSTTDMPVTLLGATVVTFPTGAIPPPAGRWTAAAPAP